MHWPKSVGFAVARKTRPISIQRGTLYVATATASWAQTLSYERLNILKKLNRHLRSPLKSIRFSTAQWMQASAAFEPERGSDPKRQTIPTRLAQHPSYIGDVPRLPKLSDQTPRTAFQRWSTAIQHMQRIQSTCPECRCHCPQGELERWARCGHCAAKRWQ